MMGRNAAPTGNEQQDREGKGLGTLLGCKIMKSEPIKVRIGGYLDGVCVEWASDVSLRTNFQKFCESRLCIALKRCALVAAPDEI